eukprot:gb/GECG01009483.1/.p1 GENE.gb/GECG01009483.1/~~gb/GECG01009483.1/.p1  ORF type:complete len:1466 (+),score=143.96 gb/GECG01009483.1/:1-4398(+)
MKRGSKALLVKPRRLWTIPKDVPGRNVTNHSTRSAPAKGKREDDDHYPSRTRFAALAVPKPVPRKIAKKLNQGKEKTQQESSARAISSLEVDNDPRSIRRLAELSISMSKHTKECLKLPRAFQCVWSSNHPEKRNGDGELHLHLLEEYIGHLIGSLTSRGLSVPKHREPKIAAGLYSTALRRTASALRHRHSNQQQLSSRVRSDIRNLTDLYDAATAYCSSLGEHEMDTSEWEPMLFNALMDSLRYFGTPGACLRRLRNRIENNEGLNDATLLAGLRAIWACSVRDLSRRRGYIPKTDKMYSLSNFATFLVSSRMDKWPDSRISTSCWNQLLRVYVVHGVPRSSVEFGSNHLDTLSILRSIAPRGYHSNDPARENAAALNFGSDWGSLFSTGSDQIAMPVVLASSSEKPFQRPFVDRFLSGFQGIRASTKRILSKSLKNDLYAERKRALELKRAGELKRFPRLVLRHPPVWSLNGGLFLPLEDEKFGSYALDGIIAKSARASVPLSQLRQWDHLSDDYKASLHLSRLLGLDHSYATAYGNQLLKTTFGAAFKGPPRETMYGSQTDCTIPRLDPWDSAREKYGVRSVNQCTVDSFGFGDLVRSTSRYCPVKAREEPRPSLRVNIQPAGYRSDLYIPPMCEAPNSADAHRSQSIVPIISGIWREMKRSGSFPNGNTAELSVKLLGGTSSSGSEHMLHLERMMKEYGLFTNEQALDALVREYAALGDLSRAFKTLNQVVFSNDNWVNVSKLAAMCGSSCLDEMSPPLFESKTCTSIDWQACLRERMLETWSKDLERIAVNSTSWTIRPKPFVALMSSLGARGLYREAMYTLELALQSGIAPTSKMLTVGIRSAAATINYPRRSTPQAPAASGAVKKYVLGQLSSLDEHLNLSELHSYVMQLYSTGNHDDAVLLPRAVGELDSCAPDWSGRGISAPLGTDTFTPAENANCSFTYVPVKVQLALVRALGCTGDLKRLSQVLENAVRHYGLDSVATGRTTDCNDFINSGLNMPRSLIDGFIKAFAIAGDTERAGKLLEHFWKAQGYTASESSLCHVIRNTSSIEQLPQLQHSLKIMAEMRVNPSEKTREALLDCCFHIAQTQDPVPAALARKHSQAYPSTHHKNAESSTYGREASQVKHGSIKAMSEGSTPLERYSVFVSEELRRAVSPALDVNRNDDHDLTKAARVANAMTREVVNFLYSELEYSISSSPDALDLLHMSGLDDGVELLRLVLLEWPVSEKLAIWKKTHGKYSRERSSLNQWLFEQKREVRRQMIESQKSLSWTAKQIAHRDRVGNVQPSESMTLGMASSASWRSRVGYHLSAPMGGAGIAGNDDEPVEILEELPEDVGEEKLADDRSRFLDSVGKRLNRNRDWQEQVADVSRYTFLPSSCCTFNGYVMQSMRGWQASSGKSLVAKERGEQFVIWPCNNPTSITDTLVPESFYGTATESGDIPMHFQWESSPAAYHSHTNR